MDKATRDRHAKGIMIGAGALFMLFMAMAMIVGAVPGGWITAAILTVMGVFFAVVGEGVYRYQEPA